MIITNNKRLPKPILMVIAIVGWVLVLYLVSVVLQDSWIRTQFSLSAIAGQIPEINPFEDRYTVHPYQTLAHTVSGVVFSILGPLQFMSPIRDRFRVVHRVSGRIFLPFGILSGIAALIMGLSFPMWGLDINKAITTVWAAFMVFAFVKAFLHIRKRQIAVHREWMIRGFAAGLGVAVFRVLLEDVLPKFGFQFIDAWNTVTAVSLPIVLIVAEFWIRATRPKKKSVAAGV